MLVNETVVTFAEAAERLPRLNGRKIHVTSIWRWARKGVQGVRLEVRRIGGRFVTSLEALDRFAKTLAELDPPDRTAIAPRSRPRSLSRRDHDIERAEAELARRGI